VLGEFLQRGKPCTPVFIPGTTNVIVAASLGRKIPMGYAEKWFIDLSW